MDEPEVVLHLGTTRPPARAATQRRRLADRLTDRHARVERRERVLKDHLDAPAAVDRTAALALRNRSAVEQHVAFRERRQTGKSTRERRLARPGLPDEADGRPAGTSRSTPSTAVSRGSRDRTGRTERLRRASSYRDILDDVALERMPARGSIGRRRCSSGGSSLRHRPSRVGNAARTGSRARHRTVPAHGRGCSRAVAAIGIHRRHRGDERGGVGMRRPGDEGLDVEFLDSACRRTSPAHGCTAARRRQRRAR